MIKLKDILNETFEMPDNEKRKLKTAIKAFNNKKKEFFGMNSSIVIMAKVLKRNKFPGTAKELTDALETLMKAVENVEAQHMQEIKEASGYPYYGVDYKNDPLKKVVASLYSGWKTSRGDYPFSVGKFMVRPGRDSKNSYMIYTALERLSKVNPSYKSLLNPIKKQVQTYNKVEADRLNKKILDLLSKDNKKLNELEEAFPPSALGHIKWSNPEAQKHSVNAVNQAAKEIGKAQNRVVSIFTSDMKSGKYDNLDLSKSIHTGNIRDASLSKRDVMKKLYYDVKNRFMQVGRRKKN